jgi:hypothetical protein
MIQLKSVCEGLLINLTSDAVGVQLFIRNDLQKIANNFSAICQSYDMAS